MELVFRTISIKLKNRKDQHCYRETKLVKLIKKYELKVQFTHLKCIISIGIKNREEKLHAKW